MTGVQTCALPIWDRIPEKRDTLIGHQDEGQSQTQPPVNDQEASWAVVQPRRGSAESLRGGRGNVGPRRVNGNGIGVCKQENAMSESNPPECLCVYDGGNC